MLLIGLVFFPMLMAFVCYGIGRVNKKARNIAAIVTGMAEFALAVTACMAGSAPAAVGQVCALGLHLEPDGFRRVYLPVISLMWMMTLLLSDEYFAHYHNRNRYYFFNLMTLGATVGVFLAADLFTALIFFEIMSFTSYTWVIQEETPGAVRAANTYLAVAVIGGLAALMGLFLLQHTLGTTEISKLYELAQSCPDRGTLYAAGGCILFGFGAKAGMFPLHIWLPKAHPVAPAPASALLSGVLTKSGVFGILAISCNLFRHDPAWGTLILLLGTVTMVLGAVLALLSIDLKRTLACSSMSQIGFILIGIGMMGLLGEEGALAARGTLLHMLNHSLFKLVLFLCAGVVYMNLHQLDLNEIRGFGRKKPILMLAFLLGAAGIGGIPLLNGYVSKTLLHESIVEGAALYGGSLRVIEWLFLISGGLTVAYMTKLFVAVFVEKHPNRQAEFDGKKRCMNALSTAALGISALLLPLLGLTAEISMNRIAELGTDFFHAGAPEHAVQYLSLENLKGAAISVAIGAAVYLLVVRKLLRKNGTYVDVLPKKLDLENGVYRPLLLQWLPAVLGWFAALFGENRLTKHLWSGAVRFGGWVGALFGENKLTKHLWSGAVRFGGRVGALFGENRLTQPVSRAFFRVTGIVSRALSDLVDALVLLLRKTVYRDSPIPDEDKTHAMLAYRLGSRVDHAAVRHGREETGGSRYAVLFVRAKNTLRDTSRRITGNLSFALLLLCAALCFVFLYLFLM